MVNWRMDLDTLVNSLKKPGINIIDATKNDNHFEIHGENQWQEFIEVFSLDGEFLGMLLRLKEELFWQVWNKDRQTVTKKIGHNKWRTVGSNNNKEARALLDKLIAGEPL